MSFKERSKVNGIPRQSWCEDLVDWTGLSLTDLCREAENRSSWRASVDLGAPTAVSSVYGLRTRMRT